MKPLHTLRAGVIGAGFIGPVHVEGLRRLGVQVTSIADLPDRVKPLADRLGIPNAFGDWREMLRSPEVDVVHIASPNKLHCEMALTAIAAGKHVICEKPLSMNSTESAKIVEASKKSKTVFAVNYMCRFYAAVLQMRAMVHRGDLGQIISVQGHFFQDWLLKNTDYNWRLLAKEGGKLRAVGDIGTHWIDAVSFILGSKATDVFAHLETFHKTRYRPKGEVQTFAKVDPATMEPYKCDTEDLGTVLMKYGKAKHGFVNGTHANVSVSQVAAGWKCSLYIGVYGTNASAQWSMGQPNEIIIGRRDEPNQILQRGTAGFSEDVAGFTDYPGGHPEGFPDSHKMNYRAVYQHIASERKTPALFATAEDGHHEVVLCEAILRSGKAKGWVKV